MGVDLLLIVSLSLNDTCELFTKIRHILVMDS
jgi:hypothetical protein